MSNEAMGHVYRYGPKDRTLFDVLLALADTSNDQHNYELWFASATLATKCRMNPDTVRRSLAELVDLGWLNRADGPSGAKAGKPIKYTFIFKDAPIVYETRPRGETDRSAKAGPRGLAGAGVGTSRFGAGGPRGPAATNTKEIPTTTKPTKDVVPDAKNAIGRPIDAAVDDLCEQLASYIGAHRGARPKVTDRWRQDMDRLIRLGPSHLEVPEPKRPEDISQALDFVFRELNEPTGNQAFCWADQIRSPGALRDHWVQLLLAGRRAKERQQGQAATMIDRVVKRQERAEIEDREPLTLGWSTDE